MTGLFIYNLRIKLSITLKLKVSQTTWQTHVQDVLQENVEMRDPSTTHGIARRQGVNFLEPSGPLQACNGIALLIYIYIYIYNVYFKLQSIYL